jgi:hypothetical protein
MEADILKERMNDKIDELKKLIEEHLKNDGDTCEASQRACLLNSLFIFSNNVNGIGADDLVVKPRGKKPKSNFPITMIRKRMPL